MTTLEPTPAANGRDHHKDHGSGEAGASGTARLGKISTRWVFVTPELAEKHLRSNEGNRRMVDSLCDVYVTEMQICDWHVTHQGIAFDEAGVLRDGQHRLKAILDSGRGQWLLVTTGLPLQSAQAIDRGRSRTLAHALQIAGVEYVTSRVIAVARSTYWGPRHSPRVVPDGVLRGFITTHCEAILEANDLSRKYVKKSKGAANYGHAGIAGLLARVRYTRDAHALPRFVAVMANEWPADDARAGDNSARKLGSALAARNWDASSGTAARVEIYRKAQSAMRAYLDGVDLSQLKGTEKDLFPLPGAEPGEGGR